MDRYTEELYEQEINRIAAMTDAGHVRPEVRDPEAERFAARQKAANAEAGGGRWE